MIGKDINDQFAVIVENLQNVILPYLDFYKDFEIVIDNPSLTISTGDFDLGAHIRQIEHCLYRGYTERASLLADELRNKDLPEVYFASRDAELKRIFNSR